MVAVHTDSLHTRRAVFLPIYICFGETADGLAISFLPYFFLQGSLISVAFISVDRFYAICWPLKHLTLTFRVYRIAIFTLWTQATLSSTTVYLVLKFLASNKLAFYLLLSYFVTLLFIVCGCYIAIWRKFQLRTTALHQQNRASQSQRLTVTLFVSIMALLSWVPLIIVHFLENSYGISIHLSVNQIVKVHCYSNSFVNPIIRVLRIPEFREALNLRFLKRQASVDIKANRATDLRFGTSRPYSSQLQLDCKEETAL